jgi:hypothetical protein
MIFADCGELQPPVLVTVYVYVPETSPVMVMLVPEPVVITPPGVRVRVHDPAAGNPLSTTLPVAEMQVGWVINPIVTAEGASHPHETRK